MIVKKNQIFYQVLAVVGIILIVMLISFVMTCNAKAKRADDDANEQELAENKKE